MEGGLQLAAVAAHGHDGSVACNQKQLTRLVPSRSLPVLVGLGFSASRRAQVSLKLAPKGAIQRLPVKRNWRRRDRRP